MASIVIAGDTSGTCTISAPAVAGTPTLTLPTTTGTIALTSQLPVAGPAFSAYASSNTNLSNSTWTKISFNTEFFDTNNNFDSTTNYRFTPTIAGYYQINASVTSGASNNNAYWNQIAIYKNGSPYIYSSPVFPAGNVQNYGSQLSQLISMNGSSDYIEVYINVYVGSGTPSYAGGSNATLLSGFLARTA
jgi:hypothetical protein